MIEFGVPYFDFRNKRRPVRTWKSEVYDATKAVGNTIGKAAGLTHSGLNEGTKFVRKNWDEGLKGFNEGYNSTNKYFDSKE